MSINQLNRVTHSSTQQCIICFEDLIDQQIGIPEHCEHTFCFTCLVEWTKVRKKDFHFFCNMKFYLL
jgi:hypothetical protein